MREYQPLRGVRILSFEAAFSLPAGTRTSADLGADVVRVAAPDPAEGRRGLDNFLNDQDVRINKSTLALNLAHPEGRALARRLVAQADVVCSNLRPGVVQRFGLDYEALHAIRPDVIVLRISGYGAPGPWATYPALGPATEAAGGLNAMTGDDSYPPMRAGSDIYADQISGRFAVLALLAALQRRHRTGQGQEIDLSMQEGIVNLLGDLVLSAAYHGRSPARRGNRHPRAVPQGIYPCMDRDEWVAISVVTDDQWRALRHLLNQPAMDDLALEQREERRRRHDEIDAAISRWSAQHEKDRAAEILQARGIPAGPVRRPSDFPRDPQLAARRFLVPVRHVAPLLDEASHPHMTLPWCVKGFGRPALADPRGEGADNARVLKRWLGMPNADVRALERGGALWPAHPLMPPGAKEAARSRRNGPASGNAPSSGSQEAAAMRVAR